MTSDEQRGRTGQHGYRSHSSLVTRHSSLACRHHHRRGAGAGGGVDAAPGPGRLCRRGGGRARGGSTARCSPGSRAARRGFPRDADQCNFGSGRGHGNGADEPPRIVQTARTDWLLRDFHIARTRSTSGSRTLEGNAKGRQGFSPGFDLPNYCTRPGPAPSNFSGQRRSTAD